jgi:hypothetical protein
LSRPARSSRSVNATVGSPALLKGFASSFMRDLA